MRLMAGDCASAADGAAMAPANRTRNCLRSMVCLAWERSHHYSAVAPAAHNDRKGRAEDSLAILDQYPLASGADAIAVLLQTGKDTHVVPDCLLTVTPHVPFTGGAILRCSFERRQWERERQGQLGVCGRNVYQRCNKHEYC